VAPGEVGSQAPTEAATKPVAGPRSGTVMGKKWANHVEARVMADGAPIA
jgi:hypothetical protein